MKTRTRLLCLLLLGATHLAGVLSSETYRITQSTANKSDSMKRNFTCFGRYASYFRTFMPFDNDPCNHAPSPKSLC